LDSYLCCGSIQRNPWRRREGIPYQDPECLGAYENAGVAVRLDEGARLTEELKIIPVVEQQ